jgi:cyclase
VFPPIKSFLFIENHPWIADGNADSLIHILNEIKTMNPSIVVPGHGPVGNIKDINTFISYLVHIQQSALELIMQMKKPEELSALPMPIAYKNWLLARFYVPNIKLRMEQLLAHSR